MLDMHCHIIPYTDDGAVDVNASLQMGREYMKRNFKKYYYTFYRIAIVF